jgi:hypothetical protein
MMRVTRVLPLLLLLLTACGKDKDDAPVTHGYADVTSSLNDARRESTKVLGANGDLHRAAWDLVSGSDAWTNQVLLELSLHRPKLEQARDLEDFCPSYSSATDYQKDTCWLRIVSAMAYFESTFRPGATYLEASGRTSVGLLMMAADQCANADSVEKLKDPIANLNCALPRLENLVARDAALSGSGNKGGAAYWSVLRLPYQSSGLYLGRKPHILLFTTSYRAYQE